MAHKTLVPLLRFTDGTVFSRVLGVESDDPQQLIRFTYYTCGPAQAGRLEKGADLWRLAWLQGEPMGSIFTVHRWGPESDRLLEPRGTGNRPPWRHSVADLKLVGAGLILGLFDNRLHPATNLTGHTRVPRLAPDWLFEHGDEPIPVELSDPKALRFKQAQTLAYVLRNAFGGRATPGPSGTRGRMEPSYAMVHVEPPRDLAEALSYRPGTMSELEVTAKESVSQGDRVVRWTVRCDDVKGAVGQTLQEALDRFLKWECHLWPEGLGLQAWLEEASLPVEEILVDQAVLEAYRLMGQDVPWVWPDTDLAQWLEAQ